MKHAIWILGALVIVALSLLLMLQSLSGNRLRRENLALRRQLDELAPLKEQATEADLKQFQGNWEFVAMEVEGAEKPEDDIKKYTVSLRGDQWTVSIGDEVKAQITFKLDPTKRPKAIDLIPAPGKGERLQGIYSLEGDQLTMCDCAVDKGDRPTEFATVPESGLVKVVLRRVKR